MDKIKGFHVEPEEANEASEELDGIVEEMLITLRLKGQNQLYCFDVTEDKVLRNHILANMGDEYDDQAQQEEN
mgnify:FL=1